MILFLEIMVNDHEMEGSEGIVLFLKLGIGKCKEKMFPENKLDAGNL